MCCLAVFLATFFSLNFCTNTVEESRYPCRKTNLLKPCSIYILACVHIPPFYST